MKIEQLGTPAFVIDKAGLQRNVDAMRARATAHSVMLRPHVKTHKTAEIAALQTDPRSRAITVSTLAEARFFLDRGFDDITYAVPITPDKLPAAAEIARPARSFRLVTDHGDVVRAMEAFGRAGGVRFRLLLKVDAGYHRAGVDPAGEDAVPLARSIHLSEALDFDGILAHGGNSYSCRGGKEIAAVARQERAETVRFAERLRQAGLPCPTVSIGSTPTAVFGESFEGVTEIRPGNYVFFDRFQADIGTCTLDDCAATVITTVAGHYPDRNRMLIDAGALALSKDPGAETENRTEFGAVVGHSDLRITSLSQEHGIVESEGPIPFDRFPIGSRLRIIPNHSCLAAALFCEYHVAAGEEIVDRWIPIRGW
jgi:D-serine deaminase-like pyridoxal phosphate-dependent protein